MAMAVVDSAAFLSSILSARQNGPQAACSTVDGYKMGNAAGTITHSHRRVPILPEYRVAAAGAVDFSIVCYWVLLTRPTSSWDDRL